MKYSRKFYYWTWPEQCTYIFSIRFIFQSFIDCQPWGAQFGCGRGGGMVNGIYVKLFYRMEIFLVGHSPQLLIQKKKKTEKTKWEMYRARSGRNGNTGGQNKLESISLNNISIFYLSCSPIRSSYFESLKR